MKTKYILIVLGEPYSTFSEILGKYFFKKKKLTKKKIIIIGNEKLFKEQLTILKYKLELNQIKDHGEAKNNIINIINIDFKFNKTFEKISTKSNKYIEKSFEKALKILKSLKNKAFLINGPISKNTFLQKKYLGITEYLSKKTKSNNEVMLIYNKYLSVSPVTTHIPLKYVTKKINKKKIINNVKKLDNFYKKILNKKAKFAILGLNPHCETIDKFSEEKKIIEPSIKYLRKNNINVKGPFPSDTFFLKKNIKNYDVIIGMYHDQVLTPIKTLFNFHAINITVGLPFVRISPDHGPNSQMLGKKVSDPSSLYCAMQFIEKLQ